MISHIMLRIIGISCDNCRTNTAAYGLLCGDEKVLENKLSDEER